ncbi:MAG: excinuclease ABC subunit A [Planctomycetota bacterium]|nr:MAG: excinuclease ABC subunit A [Planctomycetota bacterium]
MNHKKREAQNLGHGNIELKGARIHNLKNVDVTIPQRAITVVTGLSGSGKTSLAFDTIFAEGQRRYVESLSTYARRFLGKMDAPPLDHLSGISPAIAIDQKCSASSPRSMVATSTEIYDYLRLLYAKIGIPHCIQCQKMLEKYTPSLAAKKILDQFTGQSIKILAPLYLPHIHIFSWPLEKRKKEDLIPFKEAGFLRGKIGSQEYLLDEIPKIPRNKPVYLIIDRLKVTAKRRERLAQAIETAYEYGHSIAFLEDEKGELHPFSSILSCVACGDFRTMDPTPRLFSFNSHLGACPACEGLGKIDYSYYIKECSLCHGKRLHPIPLSFQVGGKDIMEVLDFTVLEGKAFFEALELNEREKQIGSQVLWEIQKRLQFLQDVGLDYLHLNRPTDTLSGGEAQRIRLATQIGNQLSGVLYVLDEPTIGLHPSDIEKLFYTLKQLKDLGNTLLVVEHDPYIIENADFIIDMGPGAGTYGGEIVAAGSPKDIQNHPESITGKYLRGEQRVEILSSKKKLSLTRNNTISLYGAATHNLKDINVQIPKGAFTVVTGVSGSGKSSLVLDTLLPAMDPVAFPYPEAKFHKVWAPKIDKIILVDQSPIGRTPSSNPATYTKVFDKIRALYATLPSARKKGYDKGFFSFNTGSGRCPNCNGDGYLKITMHFFSDVWVECRQCRGMRYTREAQEVRYRGKSIADVLQMEVRECLELFQNQPGIRKILQVLNDIGLGYIKLGQSATTLSGGEAQRLKLGAELCRKPSSKTLYVLDEPTTGLHLEDIRHLLRSLRNLVENKATVLVIEHNLEVIAQADFIIDLGPGPGEKGGYLVCSGTPEEIIKHPLSLTGKALKTWKQKEEKRQIHFLSK